MAFCQNCGRQLPSGVQVCANCGASITYNTGSSGIDQAYPATPSAASERDPTVFSSLPSNYEAPPPPPISTQYGTPPPQTPYPPYSAPLSGEYGVPPQQPRKRSRVGLIIGIVVGVVLLLCIGVFFGLYESGKNSLNANATATADVQTQTANNNPTAAPTTAPTSVPTTASGSSPSGNSIDSTAASIVTNPVMASAVDSNYRPTTTASTFQVNQKIYVTFDLNLNGSTGYVEAKWYINGQIYVSRNFAANNPNYINGYFWQEYTTPGQGAVELYWCTQSNCSDAALADFVNFTVTNAGYHSGGQMPLAFMMDMWRRD